MRKRHVSVTQQSLQHMLAIWLILLRSWDNSRVATLAPGELSTWGLIQTENVVNVFLDKGKTS